jgi:hypothetical protein
MNLELEEPTVPEQKSPGRNSPCPCGSGRKFKACCLRKGIEFRPIADELAPILRDYKVRLSNEGYSTDPEAPFFPDLDPAEAEAGIVEAMERTGMSPEFIYAFRKTGLIVWEGNEHLIPKGRLQEYHAAIADYRASIKE